MGPRVVRVGVDKRASRGLDVGVQKGGTIWGYYNVQNVAWQKVARGE